LLDHPEGADEAVRLFVSEQKAQGRLPVGAFGDIEFETNRVQAEDLAKEIRFVSGSPQQDLEVNIEFDVLGEGKPVRLMGWLTQNYQSGLVRFRSGKIRSQDYLAAWIDHLCCAVMGHGKTTHIIGYDRKEGVVHQTLQPIGDAQQVKSLLAELVRLFYQGMTAPLPYFPKTALAGVEAGFSRGKWVDDEEKSLKKMADTFNDSFAFTGEGRDTYISRIWPKWDDELAVESRMYSTLVLQAARLAAADLEDQE
ncbi:exonuclease V subunit gamma, partial [Vibrio sp. 10N.222.46.A1]